MGAVMRAAWGALCLDAAALRRWSLAWGLVLILGASLLGGLADGTASAEACLHWPPPDAAERQQVEDLAGWLTRTPLAFDAQRALVRNAAAVLTLQGDVAAVPRPLGREAGCVLTGLQRALAAPYRRLALWLPYTLAVYALARALGSRAGLAEMLAASSLYALPHLLDSLAVLPGLGPLLRAGLALWGAAIYLRAVVVAGRLAAPKALLAVLVPGLAALTLAVILLGGVAVVYQLGN